MALWMQEIGGSPVETMTSTKFTAIRYFIVQWDRREEFARYFLNSGVSYPGHTGVIPKQVTFEALNPSFFKNKNVTNPRSELGSNDWAKATVIYGNADVSESALISDYVVNLLNHH